MKYEIEGGSLPVVICHLDEGEAIVTEGNTMSWMSPTIKMETTTGGGISKAIGRIFTGEKLMQNMYTAKKKPGLVAFSSSFPGSIRTFAIDAGHEIILQKAGFLCAERGVDVSVFFQKNVASGFFGGEGFMLQKVTGKGTLFAEFDGHAIEYELQPEQQILVDTGHLAALSATCTIDVQSVPGIKNKLFGGEGFFYTSVTGPGHVWLQSLTINGMAGILQNYFPGEN